MNKLIRYCLYGIAVSICAVALFVGVYNQFFKKVSDISEVNVIGNSSITTPEETNSSFKELFTNQFFGTNYDDSKIKKIDATKNLVYTYSVPTTKNNQANTSNNTSQSSNISTQNENSSIESSNSATLNLSSEDKYSILAYIPIININNDVVNKYNTMTQTIFVNKIDDIIKNSKVYTVCNITYTSYINNDILSLAIMATLKEGDNAQRVIVQAYNYDLATGKDVTISDILTIRGLDTSVVNKKINSVVKKAASDASSVSASGYNIYQRDTASDIYDVTKVDNFMQGPNGELYIIYAYGNTSFTSEMDIIEI